MSECSEGESDSDSGDRPEERRSKRRRNIKKKNIWPFNCVEETAWLKIMRRSEVEDITKNQV